MVRPTTSFAPSTWRRPVLLWAVLTVVALAPVQAATPAGSGPASSDRPSQGLHVPVVAAAVSGGDTAPTITLDGVLDEPAWSHALAIELPWEFDPRDHEPAQVETTCFLTYDEDALYVAFRARDPEPERIRARLSDRDAAFDDDWVGFYLDTFHDQRRAFEFLINPLGVQMDLIRSEVGSGDEEDASWDAIWESAGRVTADGYVVEAAIPFTSLRFQGGAGPQTWGFVAFRARPRSVERKFASVPLDKDVDCVLCQAQSIQGFAEAEPGRNLELDPTLTAGLTAERRRFPDGDFTDDGADLEPGLTGLWGVTPNLTLSATVNPDFSQVEADVAQLDVNTRFSLFFPEKRPFFLEGADFFSTPIDAVFTRNVSAPDWGVKLTGKQGSNAIGVFLAEDSVTNLLIPGSQRSRTVFLDRSTTDAVVRYRRDVGASSTLGVLATSRDGADYSNRVYGVDGLVRLSDADRLSFQALGSATRYPESIVSKLGQPRGTFEDTAWRASYTHSASDWGWRLRGEDRGEDFRADLGFVPQVGSRMANAKVRRIWWGGDDDRWTRFEVDADYDYAEDQQGTLLSKELELGVEAEGPWQSFARLEWGGRDQTYAGVEFPGQEEWVVIAAVRPTESFRLHLFAKTGDDVDFANVRPAEALRLEPSVEVNVGRHFRLEVRHNLERFDVDAGRLYTANLTQATAVYQLSLRLFVRLVSQYTRIDRRPENYTFEVEAEDEQLFDQVLVSYKLNPQTVAFIGYSDTHLGNGDFPLTQRDRTIFMKVGYALVF